MHLCHSLGLPAYYGATLSTIIGNFVSIGIALVFLNRKYEVHFKETILQVLKTIFFVVLMVLLLSVVRIFIPISNTSRFASIFIVALYAILGAIIYIGLTNAFGMTKQILGKNIKEMMVELKKKVRRVAK